MKTEKAVNTFFFLIFIQGCYLSHQFYDNEGDVTVDAQEWGDSSVQDGEINSITEQHDSSVEQISDDDIQLLSIDNWPFEPILKRVEPEKSCENKDVWITIKGYEIHPHAIITITYPFSGAIVLIDVRNDVDECNRRIADWVNIETLKFRVQQNVTWVSGIYLVKIKNPNGLESNEVGMNLQYCSDAVEGVGDCQ